MHSAYALLALLISQDAVVGEMERGTMLREAGFTIRREESRTTCGCHPELLVPVALVKGG